MNKFSLQHGIAMMEVLISIVVIAFGFTALLKLQMHTLNNVTSSYQYYAATSLANDMGERIRANRENVIAYHNINTKTFNKDCLNNTCSMAEQDIFSWKNDIVSGAQALNEGLGTIVLAAGHASISLSWLEKQNMRDAERVSFTLEVPVE